jgi:hypothetical protein
VENLPAAGTDVDAGIIAVVDRHGSPEGNQVCLVWKPFRERLPGLSPIAAAPDDELPSNSDPKLVAFFGYDVDGIRFVGMDDDGEKNP